MGRNLSAATLPERGNVMAHRPWASISALVLAAASVLPNIGSAGVRQLAEINTSDFQALDRNATIFVMPIGVIEEHGPYLPLLTDSYLVEWLAERVSNGIVRETGRDVVILPSLPIGVGAPEDFGPRKRNLGSLPLRPETKRAVLMDLVSGIGEAGFKWVFAIDVHGPFVNKRITDQASRYFEDAYGGTMVNLTGVVDPNAPAEPVQIPDEHLKENGLAVHAGLEETSWMMYVRPDLVEDGHRDAMPVTITEWNQYAQVPNEESWPGYFGSPRLAGADVGAELMETWAENTTNLALRIIDGFDHRRLKRLGQGDNPAIARLDSIIDRKSDEIRKKQEQWLQANGWQ